MKQEWRVPQKAQGLCLYQPKLSNLIYKIKSGNVFLPGSTFVYQRRFTLSYCLWESCLTAKTSERGRKKEKRKEVKGDESKTERARAGNGSDSNNLHYWHPLALKPSRQPPWLVLLYTSMILFLGGEGSLSFRPLTHSGSLAFRLQAKGLLRVSIPTSHLERGVRHWGLTRLEERRERGMLPESSPLLNVVGPKWRHC